MKKLPTSCAVVVFLVVLAYRVDATIVALTKGTGTPGTLTAMDVSRLTEYDLTSAKNKIPDAVYVRDNDDLILPTTSAAMPGSLILEDKGLPEYNPMPDIATLFSAEDLFAIEADHGQVEQVLLNLYMNAADAMPDGGDLILKTMNVTHKDMKGKLYDPKQGNYVLLMAIDTGTGMDIETTERIFDPFFTTKEMGRGTGLGLASVYGIIKGHGGYIDVESEKEHGATFRIYFPASEKKVRKVVKTDEGIIKGSETVLLVDDDEVVMEVGRDLLGIMGYRVLLAKEGKEAIEVYRKNQQDIDLVVLDMVMPKMGGGVVYDKLKKINPDIKVLLSSGYSIDGKATEILERGCDGFIQKPFKMHELSEKIREVLEKK